METTVDISDDNSTIAFLGRPDTPERVTRIAKLHASPIMDVAVFVIVNKRQTVVIPCSEILRSCYLPHESFLTRRLAGLQSADLVDDTVVFNGYSYCVPNRQTQWFPMRALRDHERASSELQQLLPRATVYGRRFGTYPFIIRSPATRLTRISGDAYLHAEADGTETVLFTTAVFGPRIERPPSSDVEKHVQFAPIAGYGRFRLAALSWLPTYWSDGEDPAVAQWQKLFPARYSNRPHEPGTPPLFAHLGASSEHRMLPSFSSASMPAG